MWTGFRIALAALFATKALAQTCGALSSPLTVASGWTVGQALKNLTVPRGIVIDTSGHLLVVERGKGISAHTIGADGCVVSSKNIVEQADLNHGIDLAPDGKALYASSSTTVFKWTYDPSSMAATARATIVTGMQDSGLITRTLWVSRKRPEYLIVSQGALEQDYNPIDFQSFDPRTGRSTVKAFNLPRIGANGEDYNSGGSLIGYGLRNDVGISEDPAGNIWAVENAADDLARVIDGQRLDVDDNNPGEPVWNLGDPSKPAGFFGGYPYCFLVWDPSSIKDKQFQPGDWFVQTPNATLTDGWCGSNARRPNLMLPPHTAPLDLKFGVGPDSAAYASFHGFGNRAKPDGYLVARIGGSFGGDGAFTAGSGISSTSGFTEFLKNDNQAACDVNKKCFRPAGLAFDGSGNFLYITSDTTGEVILAKKGGNFEAPHPVSAGSHNAIVGAGTLALAISSLLLVALF